jgi:hypothetical protein
LFWSTCKTKSKQSTNLFSTCFTLVSCLAYSITMKTEATYSSRMSVDFNGLYGIISKKNELFITTAVRFSNSTTHYFLLHHHHVHIQHHQSVSLWTYSQNALEPTTPYFLPHHHHVHIQHDQSVSLWTYSQNALETIYDSLM